MKKTITAIFNIACVISCIVGILHFFAPYSFNWFSYIPNAPIEIYQSVNYINFCFSFLLTGFSILLIMVQKGLFGNVKELKVFYVFFVIVWFSRVIVQIVWPWPTGLQTWLLIGFCTEFILTLIPMVFLLRKQR